jgi:hypothetical protein
MWVPISQPFSVSELPQVLLQRVPVLGRHCLPTILAALPEPKAECAKTPGPISAITCPSPNCVAVGVSWMGFAPGVISTPSSSTGTPAAIEFSVSSTMERVFAFSYSFFS